MTRRNSAIVHLFVIGFKNLYGVLLVTSWAAARGIIIFPSRKIVFFICMMPMAQYRVGGQSTPGDLVL